MANGPLREWLPEKFSLTRSSSTWNSPALGAGVRAAITSHTRILMNHAVYSDTPQRRALSRRLSPSAMHSANAIHADAGSFDRDSSPSVFADQVLPHPRHSQRCSPERPRPLRTERPQPQCGHAPARPSAPASASEAISSAIAALSSATSATFSSRVIFDVISDRIGSTGPPRISVSWSISMIQEGPSSPVPHVGLCQRWFNIETVQQWP